jgi:hypothetical protein
MEYPGFWLENCPFFRLFSLVIAVYWHPAYGFTDMFAELVPRSHKESEASAYHGASLYATLQHTPRKTQTISWVNPMRENDLRVTART